MNSFRSSALIFLLVLTGCDVKDTQRPQNLVVDQCTRIELFQSCLKNVPVGSNMVYSSDWHKIVSECGSTSYHQSLRAREHVKPECAIAY